MTVESEAAAETKRMTTRRERLAERLASQHDEEGVELLHLETPAGRRLAGFWPRAADKFAPPYAAAWRVLDSTEGVLTVAPKLMGEMDRALTDENLSPVGRRSAVVGVLKSYAPRLDRIASNWRKAREAADEAAGELVGIAPYRSAEPWRWAFDIETARTVRALSADRRTALATALQLGEHADLADSLLRVPPHLAGLSAERLALIRATRIDQLNPGMGYAQALMHRCLLAGASSMDALCKLIEDGHWLPHEDLRVMLGAKVAEVREYAGRPILELADAISPANDEAPPLADEAGAAARA